MASDTPEIDPKPRKLARKRVKMDTFQDQSFIRRSGISHSDLSSDIVTRALACPILHDVTDARFYPVIEKLRTVPINGMILAHDWEVAELFMRLFKAIGYEVTCFENQASKYTPVQAFDIFRYA